MSKNKQIEEMAECLIDIQREFNEYCAKPCRECELGGIVNCENYYKAEALYNAGYRKQKEGEWITYHCTNGGKSKRGRTIRYKTYTCDVCGKSNGRHKSNYCSNCGAKMKGGAE